MVEALKSNPFYQSIPIIMLTAKIELKDKLKALKIGVDDYLTKPFVEEELIVRLANLLKNAANRQAAQNLNKKTGKISIKNGATKKIKEVPKVIDTKWLGQLEKTILGKISDINLVIDDIAVEMELSRRQFYRRIKENTGLTANQYLKSLRLTQARTLLENQTYDSVKAVSYAVGFKDVVYFSRQF